MSSATLELAPWIVESVVPPPLVREPLTPERTDRRTELLRNMVEAVTVPEDAHTMEYWQLGVLSAFKPRNAWEDWAGQQASVMMFRISRAERIERRLRDLQSLRAIDFWEEDQRTRAEETALRLATEPGPTYAALWSTVAGCDWLIARWEALAQTPAEEWTDGQKRFVRLIYPVQPSPMLTPGFAWERVEYLQEQRERNRDADRAMRALAEADISDEVSKPLARIRRYRASLQRDLKWYVAQLRIDPPDRRLDYRFHPDYDRQMVEPYPPNEPNPPAQNEPNSPAQNEPNSPAQNEPIAHVTPQLDTPVLNNPSVGSADDESNSAAEPAASLPEIADSNLPDQISITPPVRFADRQRRPDPAKVLARLRKARRRRSRSG